MNDYNRPYYPNVEPMVYHPKYGYITQTQLERKETRRNINMVFAAVLGALLAPYIFGLLIGFAYQAGGIYADFGAYPDSYGYPPLLESFLEYASVIICTALPFIIYMFARRQGPGHYFRFEKVGAGTGLLFIVAGSGLALMANFPASWLSSLIEMGGFSTEIPTSANLESPLFAVLYFISVAVFPAIFEEMSFRGVLLSSLRKHGNGFAIVVSALVFAFMHYNLSQALFAFIVGLIMGYIYLRTNNLWITIAIHGINNGISVLMELFYQYMPAETADLAGNLVFIALMAAGVVCLILLIVTKRLHFRFNGPEPQDALTFCAPASSKAVGTLTSPVLIIAAAICLINVLTHTFTL